ncbi:MAG: hypothetical protein SGPRY_000745, partial [Prymnesium sp.]
MLSAPLDSFPFPSSDQLARPPEPSHHSGDTRLPSYTAHIDQDVRGEPVITHFLTSPPSVRLSPTLPLPVPTPPRETHPLQFKESTAVPAGAKPPPHARNSFSQACLGCAAEFDGSVLALHLYRRADLVVYRSSFKINSSKPTDVLLLKHAPAQRWHFDSSIRLGQAYVFDAAATPHSSFEASSSFRGAVLTDTPVEGEPELAVLRSLLKDWLGWSGALPSGSPELATWQSECSGIKLLMREAQVLTVEYESKHQVDLLRAESIRLLRSICEAFPQGGGNSELRM